MTIKPASVEELQACVRKSASVGVRAGGTKSIAAADGDVVDPTGLSGIVDYSADECVFTVSAGTRVRDIAAALGHEGQYLPFDPPFADEGATIGGTIAAGVSGPRRYRYGGVRDFLIGLTVVDGEGRAIRSGGKVVKNAAGFLLHHGMVGSGGQFGIITEATFKVFPAPEARRTLTVECGDAARAFSTARRIERLGMDCESIDFNEGGTLTATVAGRASALDARIARLASAVGGTAGYPPASPVPRAEGDDACVKVAGAMDHWDQIRASVDAALFMCAGSVAWLTTKDVGRLSTALERAGLAGHVLRGTAAGARIGRVRSNEFEERVRRVLDPRGRFRAASHPR
jgi:glycolate oxidase FAD binding subunit